MHIAKRSSACRDTGTEPPRSQVKQSRATADPLKNPQLLIAAACPKQKASRSQSGGLVGWPYRDRTSAIAGYAIAGHCRSPTRTLVARSCSLSQTKNPRTKSGGLMVGDTGIEPARSQVMRSRVTVDPLLEPLLLEVAACLKQKCSRSQSRGLGWLAVPGSN